MADLKVLVLYKKSSFSIYSEHPDSSFAKRQGLLPKEVARFEKTHHKHLECLAKVEDVLSRYKVDYKKVCRGRPVDYSLFDIVITIGGDGTFLEASRFVTNQVMLGVNSDPEWSVGRFCCANMLTFESMLKRCLAGKARIIRLSRFKLVVKGQEIHVINDILVCHHNPAAMSRYELTIDGQGEEQKSSGIWISTAVGSTGAVKSAGGKQMPIDSDAIQYRPRELYRGRGRSGYKLRGGIVNAGIPVSITSLMREGFVFVDGSHISFPFDFGETISITTPGEPLNVICKP